MAVLTRSNRLYFLHQARFYCVEALADVVQVATGDNTVAVATGDGRVLLWDFDEEKLMKGCVNFGEVRVGLEEG